VWALVKLVEDMWHSIGDRGKASPESFDVRIRDPASSETPIEVTGCGKVNSYVRIEDLVYRVSGVKNSKGMTSRVVKSR
jgi:hypothetical protein